MKHINFNDIKSEYQEFIEHIYYAHSLSEELKKNINKFLLQYKHSKNFEENLVIN